MSWRVWLLVVAVLLFGGLLVLLWQGDAAIMRARALRHEARAQQIFRQMEDELNRLLDAEENRPLEHYRYFYVPEGLVAGSVALSVSPLAPFPPPAPIRAYLRIDPDGSLHSPHQPDNQAQAIARGWQPAPGLEAMLDRLAATWRQAEPTADDVLTVDEPEVEVDVSLADAAPAPAAEGAMARERQADQEEGQAAFIAIGPSSSKSASFGNRSGRKSVEREIQAQGALGYQLETNAIAEQINDFNSGGLEDRQLSPQQVQQDVQANFSLDADASLRVRIDPMVGSVLPDGDLLLLRGVQIRNSLHRQGMVIDVAALQDQLSAVLPQETTSSFARGGVQLVWNGRAAGTYVFDYRFEAPFQGLALSLGMAAQPSLVDGQRVWLWSLGLLLAAIGLVGAGAIERMVETRLAFARRRQNFVAAVSHELKTPLTAIRMYAEMLGGGMVRDDDQRQEYYRTIQAESERLSRMIGNVLELGKLERGAVDVQLHCGSVKTVLDELDGLLRPHIANSGFSLEISCPDDLPPALFDRELLLQVLVNACDNSLKFAAEASDKRICIDVAAVQEGLRLSLRDFGPGVAPAHLPRIFDSFYRGEDEQTRRHKGSGIGLALVRGLIESMRGRVTAENPADGGFRLCLQLATG